MHDQRGRVPGLHDDHAGRAPAQARDANGQGTQEYIVLASAFLRAGASLFSKT